MGVEQREASDGRALPPRAQRHVVRDVAAGAVAGQEQPRRVGVARQPGVRPGPGPRVGERPPERRPRVVVRRREAVLGREVVLDGQDEHPGPGHQRVQVPVVRRREGRLHDEGAAVVEHEERQPVASASTAAAVVVRPCRARAVGGEARRQVEAHGEACGGVNDDVPLGDAGGRVRGGRHGVRAHEALHAAALVEDQEREEEEVDVPVVPAAVGAGAGAGAGAHGGRAGRKSGRGEQRARHVEQEQQRGREAPRHE